MLTEYSGIAHTVWLASMAVLITLTFGTRLQSFSDWQTRLVSAQVQTEQDRHNAQIVDSVMDRCKIDKVFYSVKKGAGFLGLLRHSPYGPIYANNALELADAPDLFLETYLHSLAQADLMIARRGADTGFTPLGNDYIKKYFQLDPWPCATSTGSVLLSNSYWLLFRSKVGNMDPVPTGQLIDPNKW